MTIAKRIADELTCPWCGYEYRHSWVIGWCSSGNRQCSKCKRYFDWRKIERVEYVTAQSYHPWDTRYAHQCEVNR